MTATLRQRGALAILMALVLALFTSTALVSARPATQAPTAREALTQQALARAREALVAFAAASSAAGGDPVDDRDLVVRVGEQLPVVRAVLESGAALDVLDSWIAVTRELRG